MNGVGRNAGTEGSCAGSGIAGSNGRGSGIAGSCGWIGGA
jgi:hypothetical protein